MDAFLMEVRGKMTDKVITPAEAKSVCKLRGKTLHELAYTTFQHGHGMNGKSYRTASALATVDMNICNFFTTLRGVRDMSMGGQFKY